MLRIMGIKEESQYGVKAGDEPDFYHNEDKAKIGLDTGPIRNESPFNRGLAKGRPGQYIVKPSVDFTANLAILGHYLKAALGEYTHSLNGETNKNVHESWGGNMQYLPSFTLWGTFDNFLKEVYGAVLDSIKLELKSNEFLKGTVEWIAQDEKKLEEGLPNLATLTLPEEIDLSYLDVEVVLGEPQVDCIVNSFDMEIKNNINSEGKQGIGSRKMQAKPAAQARELSINIESNNDPSMYDLINGFEYGDITLNQPSKCKIFSTPLKIIISVCGEENSSRAEIFFPECDGVAEYEASGKDDITVKFSLTPTATAKATLSNGITQVLTDIYTKVENDVPEITAE